jgi:hypothetical protein
VKHVDPEMLAAWADDALSTDEARIVEAHLAGCSQCRAVAAAFTRTLEPVLSAAATLPANAVSSTVKWVLPFAATIVIAAGLAWKLWPRAAEVRRVSTEAQTLSAPPPAPAAQPAIPPIPIAEPKVETSAASPKPAKRQFNAPQRALPVAPLPPPVLAAPAVMPPVPAPAPAPPPPPPTPLPQAAPPVWLPTQASPPGTMLDKMQSISAASAQQVRASGGGGGGRGGRGGSVVNVSPRTVVITSTSPLLWRISASNVAERSTDEGVTWSVVPIAAEGVQFTFGSAPNTNACWLIGRMGAVFLSTKGEAFKRLPFPENVDLATIIATDELKATVIARDGRAFSTTDGGQTWQVARF